MKTLTIVTHPGTETGDNRDTLALAEINDDGSTGAFVARMHPDRLEYAQLIVDAVAAALAKAGAA